MVVWILPDIVVLVMTVSLSETTWKLEKRFFKNLSVKVNRISMIFYDESQWLRDWLCDRDTNLSGMWKSVVILIMLWF